MTCDQRKNELGPREKKMCPSKWGRRRLKRAKKKRVRTLKYIEPDPRSHTRGARGAQEKKRPNDKVRKTGNENVQQGETTPSKTSKSKGPGKFWTRKVPAKKRKEGRPNLLRSEGFHR